LAAIPCLNDAAFFTFWGVFEKTTSDDTEPSGTA